MRALILVAGAALAVSACGGNEAAENEMNVDNITADNLVINDTTAIDATTNLDANMANDMNMTNDTNAADNADANATGNNTL